MEPASGRVPLLPAPGIPEKRKRATNVQHQLPVRKSERLIARACRNTETVNDVAKPDNYLDIVKDSENEEDEGDDYFESTKSHLGSDTEENDKVIEERVEAELQKKAVVTQPTTGHQQTSLPFSSTPVNKNQNLYTASVPLPKVEPATLPARPENTQPLPSVIRKLSPLHNRYLQPTHPPNSVRSILSDRP